MTILSAAASLHAAIDWGGGAAVFQDSAGTTLSAATGVGVLVSVHQGETIDYSRHLPTTSADLVTPGAVLADEHGNENIVLAVCSDFLVGYLMNSAVPDITEETQKARGAGYGEDVLMVVWDRTTFVNDAPGEGSRFATVPLYAGGDTGLPARTYGNVPPALPLSATPATGQTVVTCSSTLQSPQQRSLVLEPGWNLVSTPLVLDDPTPDVVFGGHKSGPVWEWQIDHGRSVYSQATAIETKRGYWVLSTAGGAVDLSGVAETDPDATLPGPGWSLIGPLANTTVPGSDVLPYGGWWWDAAAQAYRRIGAEDTMVVGRGYWFYVLVETQIDVRGTRNTRE